ncbi:MAG TPA: hypothetical protein VMZ29_01095 [Candidatus Bathyarchaeia archaeon]|nr:hypothetical protein [Candidatus Bathyarchaeia archaeon]
MGFTNKELYKISKSVFKEATLHQQIQAAGSNKTKYLEKVDRNRGSVGAQSIVMKILVAFYIVIFTIIPVNSFMQINIVSEIPEVENISSLFVGGLSLSAFMLLQLIILIIFTVTFTWGFLSKEPYTWVSTLPFSRNEISKIGFFSFSRGIDVQLIVMALVLPIGAMIGINFPIGKGANLGTNLLMIFVCLIINLANTIFNISVAILLGRKMARVMEDQEENNKMANFIRIGTILFYLIFSMLASYGIQLVIQYLPLLYNPANPFITANNAEIISIILSLIPFPFSGGFLLSSIAIGFTNVPIFVVIGSIIGSSLQIVFAILLFKKVLFILQGLTSMDITAKKETTKKKPSIIKIRVISPTRAYLKRDLAIITRELQTITFMIMPIMIPISAALAFPLTMIIGTTGIPAMVIYIFAFAVFSTFFILIGITSIESGGETITSSLPINIRDQIKAKIPLLFSTVPLMVLVAVIIQIKKPIFIDILIFIAVLFPAIFIIGMIGLLLKVIFFGKMRYKYVIDEVNTKNRELKYIGILVIMFLFAGGIIASLMVEYWVTLIIEGVFLILLLIAFNLMFPKKNMKLVKSAN